MLRPNGLVSLLQRLLHRRESGIILPLLGLMALITGSHHSLATVNNLYLISRQIALTAIIAVGNGSRFGFSVPVILLLVIALLAQVVLKHTAFGRRVYAIGGNEEATALSGINTRKVKFFTYVICGALSAVTGMLFVARFQSAQADAGKGMELDAIAATVIGGTSLMGGEGSVAGVLIGAIDRKS